MQPKTRAPRTAYTSAQIDACLAFTAGAVLRWGVDVYDGNGVLRTSTQTLIDSSAEWNAGTLYEVSTTGNTLSRP